MAWGLRFEVEGLGFWEVEGWVGSRGYVGLTKP